MAYCTAIDVRAALTEDAVSALTGGGYDDAEAREAYIAGLIDNAVADADGEIDGYLAKRYAVPLTPPPRAIGKLAKDIALYNLWARIGIDETGRDKTYLTRYKAAVDFLRLVAEGKVDIGAGGLDAGQTPPSGTIRLTSAPRIFSRRSLRGM